MITDWRSLDYYRQHCDCGSSSHKHEQAAGWPEQDLQPVHTTTDPWPAGLVAPKPVLDLQRLGEREGWEVRLGYSRGLQRAVKVGTYKDVETIGVWAGGQPWRWSAQYSRTVGKTWSWSAIAIWHPGHLVAPGLGLRFLVARVTDLKEWLAVRGSVGAPWFKAVHARVEDQKVKAREAARARPRGKKEGSA